jgi:branched-chain amino acid transport system ATP-binding protein
MVEQNARAALHASDRGYVFAEGKNALQGSAAELLGNPVVNEIFLGKRSQRKIA